MQAMAKATGTVRHRRNCTFSAIAAELGGQGRSAAIDGRISSKAMAGRNMREGRPTARPCRFYLCRTPAKDKR